MIYRHQPSSNQMENGSEAHRFLENSLVLISLNLLGRESVALFIS